MEKIIRHCMTCGNPTTNESGFCSVRGWDSCQSIFLGEYKTKPTKKELTAMIITSEIKSEQK